VTPSAREHRFRRLKELGCIACWYERLARPPGPPEIHHLNLGGKAGQKRRGDEFTIPLCAWHHQGRLLPGRTSIDMFALFGPSLARQSRAFRERYGTDDELLSLVNRRIARLDRIATGHLTEAQRTLSQTGE
jgi:hypothetical protein